MSDEAAIVVRALADELRALDRQLVREVRLTGGKVHAFDDALNLSAIVHRDPGMHPALAHVHVIAEIGRGPTATLDACIVGINPDRSGALAETARNWVGLVASPVLSLLHAGPVLGAAHFEGGEPWGVAGYHGFVGPLAARGGHESLDLDAMAEAPLFAGTSERTPPGTLHLVKVTLNAVEGRRWERTLEIDGHSASHTDPDWPLGQPVPGAFTLCTRFAVFFRIGENAEPPDRGTEMNPEHTGASPRGKRWWQFWR